MSKRKSLIIIFIGFLIFNITISFITTPNDLSYNNQQTIDKPKTAADLVGAENIIITETSRQAHMEIYGLISISDELTIKNLNDNPVSSILIGIPLSDIDYLVFFESEGPYETTLFTERLFMIIDEFEMLAIYFNSPILPHQSITITFEHIYKDLIKYNWYEGAQIVFYKSFTFPILPYRMEGKIESVYYTPQSADEVDGGWGFHNPGIFAVQYLFDEIKAEIGANYITPFLDNLNDKKNMEVGYNLKEGSKIEIEEITRDILISPWGTIRVKENIMITNLGFKEFRDVSFNIPQQAIGVYVSDVFGEILGTTIQPLADSEYKKLNINLLTNRVLLLPNSSFLFNIEYHLPFENYFSMNWFQESIEIDIFTTIYEYLGRQQTIKINIEGCYSIDHITDPPVSIKKSQGATTLVYTSEDVTFDLRKVIQFTFTIDLFDLFLRPTLIILIIALIGSIYVLSIKTRKKEFDTEILKKEFIPVNEIREFCALFEEKNALTLEIRLTEEDTKRKKIAKKNFKNIFNKNTSKIENIQQEIIPFKKVLTQTGEIFESIINKLDILEAERISIKDSLNLLESRYKRGRLPSRAAFLKLSNDFKKRRKKIDRSIDKLIQQLRSYLL